MIKSSKRKYAYLMFAVVIVLVVILAILISNRKERKEKIKNVSLIVYGNDVNRWDNLRQGAEQACKEENAEVTLTNMSSETNSQEQIYLINREILGGADALLIAACDSKEIGEYIAENNIKIPIVFVEDGIDSNSKYACVKADDYEMGKNLGNKIVEGEKALVKIAIISDVNQRESNVLREKGLRDVIEPFANDVVTWERKEGESTMLTRKFLQRAMLEEAVDVVVSLNNESTDALMDALDNLNRETKVYAISTSDESVYYLDKQKIKALEYQAEFSIGYIGAKKVLGKKNEKLPYGNEDIKYLIVNKENMYDHENQILLFPFVR